MAIGARSQSARTYLEKNLDKFADSNQDELIKHCMRALRDTLPNEVELTVKVNQIHFNIINIKTKLLFLFRIVLLRLLERIHHLLYWMMLVLVLI
jgi:20S proteasome alpha/beta subunit